MINRLFRTLIDIGPNRLQKRIRLELRKIIDKMLSEELRLYIIYGTKSTPQWSKVLEELDSFSYPPPKFKKKGFYIYRVRFSK